jgi:hypothetical protein
VDSNQASHWKDDVDGKGTLQTYMGVMDPSLLDSLKYSFTLPDLRAFSRLGYRVSRTLPRSKYAWSVCLMTIIFNYSLG